MAQNEAEQPGKLLNKDNKEMKMRDNIMKNKQ